MNIRLKYSEKKVKLSSVITIEYKPSGMGPNIDDNLMYSMTSVFLYHY